LLCYFPSPYQRLSMDFSEYDLIKREFDVRITAPRLGELEGA
jgi:hypothetical protein